MENILIFIKHHLGFLWKAIEWLNSLAFSILYRSGMLRVSEKVIEEHRLPPYHWRIMKESDAGSLFDLINKQDASELKYFKPHGFDPVSIKKQFLNRSFLMMGVFDGEIMIGYFFLRFFINKKCFVGRLIDKNFRGKGLGNVMNSMMYKIAWRMDFRCLSTISRKNTLVMKAHSGNSCLVVLKELQNDYLLVEFLKPGLQESIL